MSKICLDTNALISSWDKWYNPDHHDFFDGLLYLAEQGRVLISEEVYDEVKPTTPLGHWLSNNERLLKVTTDERITSIFKRLVNKHQRAFLRAKTYRDAADPYVIATAQANNAIVVTDENPNQETKDSAVTALSISAVCVLENIPWIRPYEVIRMAGWHFRIDTGADAAD